MATALGTIAPELPTVKKPVPVPKLTKEARQAITAELTANYKASGVTYAGFTVTNIADYMFGGHGKVQLAQAEAVIRAATGQKQTKQTSLAGLLIPQSRLANAPGGPGWGADIRWGLQHLAEHPAGSHYHGGLGGIVNDVFRGFAAMFTLGLSELSVGGKRLGVTTGVQSLVSTELSGGAIQSEAPSKQIATIEKIVGTGASLVSGGAALLAAPETLAAGEVGSRVAAQESSAALTASETFGTASTKSLQVARLGIADFAGTTPQAISIAGVEPAGAALELPAAQLGLTTEQVLAPASESFLSTSGKLSNTVGKYAGTGAAGQQLMNVIEHGNLSDIVNTVFGLAGIPVQVPGGSTQQLPQQPGGTTTPTRADAAGGGLLSGGGVANPTYVTDPAAVNIPMYVAGLGLLIVIGIIMFRGRT